jgi:hypothetical protein
MRVTRPDGTNSIKAVPRETRNQRGEPVQAAQRYSPPQSLADNTTPPRLFSTKARKGAERELSTLLDRSQTNVCHLATIAAGERETGHPDFRSLGRRAAPAGDRCS